MDKMYSTKNLIDREIIPKELIPHIMQECPYCGYPIARNEKLTMAECANINCVGHMQYRADALVKFLGIKGIGPKTCLNIIQTKRLKNHFEIIPYVTKEKPKVHLWEIANMAFIPGYGSKFQDLLAGYQTFEDYFNKASVPLNLRPYRSKLVDAQKYFIIKRALSSNVIEVMLNGSFTGFKSRQDFVNDCNTFLGQVVQVKSVGVKKSADYCITENKNSNERKVRTAREVGIPILTPKEFLKELIEEVTKVAN